MKMSEPDEAKLSSLDIFRVSISNPTLTLTPTLTPKILKVLTSIFEGSP